MLLETKHLQNPYAGISREADSLVRVFMTSVKMGWTFAWNVRTAQLPALVVSTLARRSDLWSLKISVWDKE